jgi:hypothetical protein
MMASDGIKQRDIVHQVLFLFKSYHFHGSQYEQFITFMSPPLSFFFLRKWTGYADTCSSINIPEQF